ncbi:MAG: TfoX family protein [Alphaproteobacteria bacterium]|nr:MAG: TfoX family protein [Alphaproteobacteria bacterium]
MAFDAGLVELVREALGDVSMRQMMGAATLYWDGRIFAIVDETEIWFKADAESAAIWEEAGSSRFTFTSKDGRTESMNYWRAPADVYDDPDAMREWAGIAIAASQRAPAKKPKKKKA